MAKKQAALATELQQLLLPLMDGKPLDLSLLASMQVSERDATLTETDETALAHSAADHLALFEKHIGPYEKVLANAARHVENYCRDEVFCYRTQCEPVNHERYEFPRFAMIEGPRPDPCRWVGLFLGRERQERLKAALENYELEEYENLRRAIVYEAKWLSVLELMRNVLTYLREESQRLPEASDMLRFCALYGLSGAIDDVLGGKYGPVGSLTIDTVLPFKEHNDPPIDSFYAFDDLFMPAWAIGAVLGFTNVVGHCIHDLGANTNSGIVLKVTETGEMKEEVDKFLLALPGFILYWTIKTNQPEMVSFLATECGFQFRWISTDMENLFMLLFHVNGMRDEFGPWRSRRYNPDEYMFDCHGQRAFRARCCLEEKQKMLQAMIDAGLPQDLFLPQINVKVERVMMKFMEDNGMVHGAEMSKLKKFFDALSKTETKARCRIYDANATFNSIQEEDEEDKEGKREEKTLTLLDFYEKAVGMWKNQSTAQAARLSDREELDPRWKQYDEKGEEAFIPWWGQKSEYDSDDESFEGSDYDY